MLLVIRHANDEYEDPSYRHDNKLSREGRYECHRKIDKLISLTGPPTHIYCSPYRRTIETARLLNEYDAKIIKDVRLSRYFTSSQKLDPHVSPKTLSHNVPIEEDRRDLDERIRSFIKDLKIGQREGDVIWIISHAIIVSRITHYYDPDIDTSNINFLSGFKIKISNKRNV